jgi:hypothetical protein
MALQGFGPYRGGESSSRGFLSPWRLSWVALVLLALYGVIVLGSVVPVRLMDPAWQLSLYNVVVNASAFPLVGLGLLHLAAELNPESRRLARRASFFAQLAVPIALGFLLLIPLQGFLLWQNNNNLTTAQTEQLNRRLRTITSLRWAVEQADSSADLQQRFEALQGPTLGPAEQALPLSQLKSQLNTALEQADQALQNQQRELPATDPLRMLGQGLRNGFACLALAIGFAAVGQRRDGPVALLMEWQKALNVVRFPLPRDRSRGRVS